MDAVPAAGVVEEQEFLDRAGMHLAVFGQLHCRLGKAVGLAREKRGQSRLSSRSSVFGDDIFGRSIFLPEFIFQSPFDRKAGAVNALDALILKVLTDGVVSSGSTACMTSSGSSASARLVRSSRARLEGV